MKYTKFPNAVKAFIDFTMEAENYNPWLESAVAYLTHPLNAYDANAGLGSRIPSLPSPRMRAAARSRLAACGSVGEKAASALADFLVMDMFASVCTRPRDPAGSDCRRRAPGEAHLSGQIDDSSLPRRPEFPVRRFLSDGSATDPGLAGTDRWLSCLNRRPNGIL